MNAKIILTGIWLLVVGLNFILKRSKAYWWISGYAEMPENKRKNVDWSGTANLLFYGALMVFFILLILGFILPDVIFWKIYGLIVI
jgi:hypothetical protein